MLRTRDLVHASALRADKVASPCPLHFEGSDQGERRGNLGSEGDGWGREGRYERVEWDGRKLETVV
jgi:hypothetical protein